MARHFHLFHLETGYPLGSGGLERRFETDDRPCYLAEFVLEYLEIVSNVLVLGVVYLW